MHGLKNFQIGQDESALMHKTVGKVSRKGTLVPVWGVAIIFFRCAPPTPRFSIIMYRRTDRLQLTALCSLCWKMLKKENKKWSFKIQNCVLNSLFSNSLSPFPFSCLMYLKNVLFFSLCVLFDIMCFNITKAMSQNSILLHKTTASFAFTYSQIEQSLQIEKSGTHW